MEVQSTRFGRIEFSGDDILRFPEGLPGLPDCHDWLLLADPTSDSLVWLQSTTRPEVALAAISPRRFVPGHQVRVCRRELAPLGLDRLDSTCVLAIVNRNGLGLTVNLKAPLVIDVDRRMGRQVIANGDLRVQHPIALTAAARKKIA